MSGPSIRCTWAFDEARFGVMLARAMIGVLAHAEADRELLVDAQLALHCKDVALGFGQVDNRDSMREVPGDLPSWQTSPTRSAR